MKREVSMQSVNSLFRLDLKSRFGTTHKIGMKSRAMKTVNLLFSLIVYAVLVWGIYYLSNIFIIRSGLRIEFLTIVTAGTLVLATAISTGNVIKNLYMNGDNEMLLRFPVSGKEILISKSIYCYLHNVVVCFLTMMPFYVMYGVVTEANAGFYFAAIGIVLLSTLLPYFLANIFAVPVMLLMNVIKNQFLLVLLLLIGVICGLFVFYMESLGNVINYLGSTNQTLFSPEVIQKYQQFADFAYPFKWYAILLNGGAAGFSSQDIGLSFLYIFLLNAALGVIAYFVTTRAYYRTILYGIQTEKTSFVKKTRNVQRTVFGTLLRREFFLIFRSFNYSFQYLAMACAMPLMVYYCNSLATALGKQSVGAQIVPGLTLLVIIIFVTTIVSFASTTISREGNAFYHTKIIPVKYSVQVGTKFFLYAIVAMLSVAISCLMCALTFGTEKGGNLLTPTDIAAIFGISEMVVISLTCLSIWADVKSPTFNVAGDGEMVAANKNVAVSLFTGIILAILYGVFTMIFSFMPLRLGGWEVVNGVNDVYIVLSVVTIILMAISFCALYVNLNKRYKKIVP